jgi:hypothetical protein
MSAAERYLLLAAAVAKSAASTAKSSVLRIMLSTVDSVRRSWDRLQKEFG